MTRLTVEEYAAALRPRYRTARRRDKKKSLDEFCETTGLHRKAAIRLLNLTTKPKARRRGRPRRYGPEVTAALVRLWEVGDRMCGKLLHAVMPDLLAALERHGELRLPDRVRSLVLQASPATPYQRLLASGCLTDAARAELERQYLACNPAQLQARIDQHLRALWRLAPAGTRPNQGGWATQIMRHHSPVGNRYF